MRCKSDEMVDEGYPSEQGPEGFESVPWRDGFSFCGDNTQRKGRRLSLSSRSSVGSPFLSFPHPGPFSELLFWLNPDLQHAHWPTHRPRVTITTHQASHVLPPLDFNNYHCSSTIRSFFPFPLVLEYPPFHSTQAAGHRPIS